MATAAITIKMKGAQAAKALCANPQFLSCLKANGAVAAGLGKGAALPAVEVEGVRAAALGKGGFIPGGEFEGQFLGGTGKGMGFGGAGKGLGFGAKAGLGKSTALAGKGATSWACFGLGPWGALFLLTTVGMGALAYYVYRNGRLLAGDFDVEPPPV